MGGQAEVLVVDDVVAIVEELVTLLDLHKIGAHGATHLGEALEVLQRNPRIGVIACDVRLDRESGLDIVPLVLAHPALRHRPFRFLFMSGDPIQAQQFPATSAHLVLTKPVRPGALIRAISEMLDADVRQDKLTSHA